MGFESDLVTRQVGDIDWKLVEPLKYRGNTDLFVAPTGKVLELPANTTGVGVRVLDADCLFVGVATLYTGNP